MTTAAGGWRLAICGSGNGETLGLSATRPPRHIAGAAMTGGGRLRLQSRCYSRICWD